MWIPQLPKALWWDHNQHYHRWLLRQLPQVLKHVLDVGCGSGQLACGLSVRADSVDALDSSSSMIGLARHRCPDARNITWVTGDLLDPAVPVRPEGYDTITAVASLHHMPLVPVLDRLAELLRPGGKLVVVGLYRATRRSDLALELVRVPANAVVGFALALWGRSHTPDDDSMPVRPPVETLQEIRIAVGLRLPEAHLRRGLFWRYLLTWQRPPDE